MMTHTFVQKILLCNDKKKQIHRTFNLARKELVRLMLLKILYRTANMIFQIIYNHLHVRIPETVDVILLKIESAAIIL